MREKKRKKIGELLLCLRICMGIFGILFRSRIKLAGLQVSGSLTKYRLETCKPVNLFKFEPKMKIPHNFNENETFKQNARYKRRVSC